MEIKGFKFIEIKGGMKQTHRRVGFSSGSPISVGTHVVFECQTDKEDVLFHIINDAPGDDNAFDVETSLDGNVYFLETDTEFKGEHKIKAVIYDETGKVKEESDYFIINVK